MCVETLTRERKVELRLQTWNDKKRLKFLGSSPPALCKHKNKTVLSEGGNLTARAEYPRRRTIRFESGQQRGNAPLIPRPAIAFRCRARPKARGWPSAVPQQPRCSPPRRGRAAAAVAGGAGAGAGAASSPQGLPAIRPHARGSPGLPAAKMATERFKERAAADRRC